MYQRDGQRVRKLLILLFLAGLVVACSASDPGPGPTVAPTAGDQRGIDVDAGSDRTAEMSVTRCTEVDPHPVGVSIAEKFDVSYERVMTWFCGGYSFDEILVALQTSGMSDRAPEELLAMRANKSWDQIWTELGIVGP